MIATHKSLVRKTPEGARQEPKNLAQILADLRIVPYTPQSVRQYKRRMAWRLFMWSIPGRLFQGGIGLCFGSLVMFVLFAFIGAVHLLAGNPGWWTGLITTVSGGLGALLFLVLLSIDNRTTPLMVYRGKWHRRKVYSTQSLWNCPEYARQSATELFASGYPMTLLVEEFDVEHIGVADPFLVVVDEDSTEFYLEVWEEPGFKKSW